jgi:hypothetical protein
MSNKKNYKTQIMMIAESRYYVNIFISQQACLDLVGLMRDGRLKPFRYISPSVAEWL